MKHMSRESPKTTQEKKRKHVKLPVTPFGESTPCKMFQSTFALILLLVAMAFGDSNLVMSMISALGSPQSLSPVLERPSSISSLHPDLSRQSPQNSLYKRFTKLVTFGDSLTDGGNFDTFTLNSLAYPYGDTGFNSGYPWTHFLSKLLAMEPSTNSLDGGDNFAFGGAFTMIERSEMNGETFPVPIPSMTSQIDAYLSSVDHKPDPTALHILWCGHNDVLVFMNATDVSTQQLALSAFSDFGAAVIKLTSAGVEQSHIFLCELLDFFLSTGSKSVLMSLHLNTLMLLACTPNLQLICTREYSPVCAEGKDYANACLARAAGYGGECSNKVQSGTCSSLTRTPPLSCSSSQVFSELGYCVLRPWSDFVSCSTEKDQGACRDGRDPNDWVIENCALTCAT